MNAAKTLCFGTILGLGLLTASAATAAVVSYTLEDVILDEGNAQMFGDFTWTYEVDDFENGVGEFTFLDIPFTGHDHTDLEATFDIGGSIEITLDGSSHDDGVDITLFLLEPLTPTTGTAIDLVRSKYEIGGNGFHDGLFLSGSVLPPEASEVGDLPSELRNTLSTSPNPIHPSTIVTYSLARSGLVQISIHDVRGRRVTTLVEQWQSSGSHSVPWNGAGLESGLYLVRFVTEAESRTDKVLLLR